VSLMVLARNGTRSSEKGGGGKRSAKGKLRLFMGVLNFEMVVGWRGPVTKTGGTLSLQSRSVLGLSASGRGRSQKGGVH